MKIDISTDSTDTEIPCSQITSVDDKVFHISNSYLTDVLKSEHLQPIYNIFWIMLIILATYIACQEYLLEDCIYLGLRSFKSGFTGIHYSIICWCLEHLIAFLVFYVFKKWCGIHAKIKTTSLRYLVNLIALLLYISSQIFATFIAAACCLRYNLPFPAAVALLMGTVRLLMKMYAFVRTNTGCTLTEHSKTGTSTTVSNFTHYLYFLFAPTLIYRDNYPRLTTRGISYPFVAKCILELTGVMFLFAFLSERYINVYFIDYGKEKLKASMFVETFFSMIIPSTLYLLGLFYVIVHVMQNLFAELLLFGDRTFYRGWWSTTNFRAYFRTWNLIVQNWLHEYVYKDFRRYISSSRVMATIFVIIVSAIAHEFILIIALQFFLPVMFIQFTFFGIFLMYFVHLPKRYGNIFVWMSLILGNTTMIYLYCTEYYAKLNCPKEYRNFLDYVIPNIWTCFQKYE